MQKKVFGWFILHLNYRWRGLRVWCYFWFIQFGEITIQKEEINDSIGHFGSHHSFYHAFAICGVCSGVFQKRKIIF